MKKEKTLVYEKREDGVTMVDGKIYRIPATHDYMFKNLFGVSGKEENLKGLLEAILKVKLKNVVIENPELPKDYEKGKKGILDVRARLEDGTIVFIEMQVKNENNIGERGTFYLCKIFISTIEEGQGYNDTKKAIAIIITDFSYFNRKEYHQIGKLKFEDCIDENEIVEEIKEESEYVTDKIEIHIIDLRKFRKIKSPKGELADWINLIIGEEGEIEMAVKRNNTIAKVNEENRRLSADKKMQEQYWYEQKELYAENTRMSVAKEEGREEGKKVKTKEIAKKMKLKNIDIEEICEITGLTKYEVENL